MDRTYYFRNLTLLQDIGVAMNSKRDKYSAAIVASDDKEYIVQTTAVSKAEAKNSMIYKVAHDMRHRYNLSTPMNVLIKQLNERNKNIAIELLKN